MEETQVGWIAAIIIGGIAGWLAEQFMHSNMGMLMNIILGIIGAAIASCHPATIRSGPHPKLESRPSPLHNHSQTVTKVDIGIGRISAQQAVARAVKIVNGASV